MSYNKNTINLSNLDSVSRILKDLNIEHRLINLGKVRGMGVNDDYSDIDSYTLRALVYKDKIEVDQMQRSYDCDSDDFIVSKRFDTKDLPEKFPLEIYLDYENFVDWDSDDNGMQIEDITRVAKKEDNFINLKEIIKNRSK